MKRLIATLYVLSCALMLVAQVPQMLNYQGVLKNADGTVRPEAEVTVTLEFLSRDEVVYREEHVVKTNAVGYFALKPGTGTATLGAFEYIDWLRTPIVVRTLLDGEVMEESPLSSVPFALMAAHVEGEDAAAARMDSLAAADAALLMRIDTLDRDKHLMQTAIDSLRWKGTGMNAAIDSVAREGMRLQAGLDSLAATTAFYNVTALHPLPAGDYYTLSRACTATPQHVRKPGIILTFRSDSAMWSSYRFASGDTARWGDEAQWTPFGSYANLTLPYAQSAAGTRLQVPLPERKQGLIVSYHAPDGMVNEQYTAVRTDDEAWAADSLWLSLADARDIARIDSALYRMEAGIARMDSAYNALQADMESLATREAWYYTDRMDIFSQVGYIDALGNEVFSTDYVHSPLLPLSPQWVVTTCAGSRCPAVSYFTDEDYSTRIPLASDSTGQGIPGVVTVDLATDDVPQGARYFAVNLLLNNQQEAAVRYRMSVADVTVDNYNYSALSNVFAYIGAYVTYTGEQRVSSRFRHSRFLAIAGNRYKVMSTGMFSATEVAPVVVYYSDSNYASAVGYDIGSVSTNGTTTREIIITENTVPEGANYFIVNWLPTMGSSSVMSGSSTESMLFASVDRLDNLEANQSCYANRKLVTLGDSFTINTGNLGIDWQLLLSQWLGLQWSATETINGVNGKAPMGYGGSWIMPNDKESMSLRCMDVRSYNPDVIILYGGQNDKLDNFKWGSMEDEPFMPSQFFDLSGQEGVSSLQDAIAATADELETPHTDCTVINVKEAGGEKLYYITDASRWNEAEAWCAPADTVSFYAAYKGILQRLCTDNPRAAVYCLTLMQCDYSRYDNSLGSIEEVDALRRRKCEAIKEIAAYYGVQVIDLWNDSGVSRFNAPSLYSDWLHPNVDGYRKLAECVYRSMK